MIIIEPCAGLGNRLLGLGSAYHWAKENNEELTIFWKTEEAIGARYQDIFSIPQEIKVIEAKDFGYKVHPLSQLRYNVIKSHFKKKADYFLDVGEVMDLYKEGGKDAFTDIIKNNSLKYFRVFSDFYPIEDIENPLGFIKPTDTVMKRVHDTMKNADCNDVVGIHIRRSDNQVCINNSPLELFINQMKREIEENEKTKFYLASDDQPTIDELIGLFGDRVLIMKDKNFSRVETAGIIDAFAEMLCLSNSKKIIGSFYSSYSRVASIISGVPLEIMQIENLIPW